MKILFVCDFRSPTARNWIDQFLDEDIEVHVLSTFPVETPIDQRINLNVLPIAFSRFGNRTTADSATTNGLKVRLIGSLTRKLRSVLGNRLGLSLRAFVAPIEVYTHTNQGKCVVRNVSPDIVHALRIPFEGMFATLITPPGVPLAISVWGNDFTLHAPQNPLIGKATRRTLARTNALLSDTRRDVRLAQEWGLDKKVPTLVVPGAGGLLRNLFYPGEPNPIVMNHWGIDQSMSLIINPRGVRGYVRTIELLDSFPLVLERYSNAVLLLPGTQGNAEIEMKVDRLGISKSVRLGPTISQEELAELYRASTIAVSPSTHDGTPNSLLESMASGCFPVSGDIESIHEWIEHGVNGLLCDPINAQSIGAELLRALSDHNLRSLAIKANLERVSGASDRSQIVAAVKRIYDEAQANVE